jgi:hypothetical protein
MIRDDNNKNIAVGQKDLPTDLKVTFNLSKRFKSVFELAYALVDLQSAMSTFYYVGTNLVKVPQLPTTTRNFTKGYEELFTLNDFRSGSFGADIATAVIAGLFLKFLESLFLESPKHPNTAININGPIQVNIHDPLVSDIIDKIIKQTKINPNNTEQSVQSFLDACAKSNLKEMETLSYDQNGIKVLVASIERLGNSIDINA